MKRVVIFGGNGIVGRALADQLLPNYHVVSLDSSYSSSSFDGKYFESHYVDIYDFEQVQAFLQKDDIVFNLAAMSRISSCNQNPLKSLNVNLVGAVNIMEASERAEVARVLLASSLYANGMFGGFYSASKRSMEQYALTYSAVTTLSITILKLGSIAGFLDDTNSLPTRIIRRIAGIDNQNIKVNTKLIRDYLPLDGVVQAMEKVMISPDYKNCSVEFVTGPPIKVEELIASIDFATNRKTVDFIELMEKEIDFADQYVDSHTGTRDFMPIKMDISSYCESLDDFIANLYRESFKN